MFQWDSRSKPGIADMVALFMAFHRRIGHRNTKNLASTTNGVPKLEHCSCAACSLTKKQKGNGRWRLVRNKPRCPKSLLSSARS